MGWEPASGARVSAPTPKRWRGCAGLRGPRRTVCPGVAWGALGRRGLKTAQRHPKNATYVQSYQNLTDLRENFEELIKVTESMGRLDNEKRDFDNQIEKLSSRNTDHNMERIVRDLNEVKKENKKLRKALKGARDDE